MSEGAKLGKVAVARMDEIARLNDPPDYSFAISLIGDMRVGKSNLIARYTNNVFNDYGPGMYYDLYLTKQKKIIINHKVVELSISTFDPIKYAYRTENSSIYRRRAGFLVCYDVQDPVSFNNTKQWMMDIDRYARPENYVKVLVGLKSDLPSNVPLETAQELAESLGLIHMTVSSKESLNITELFEKMATMMIKEFDEREEEDFDESDLIDFPKPKRNSSSLYSKISGKIKEKKGKQEEKENEKKERKQREKEKKEKEKEEEEEKEEKEEEEEKGKEKENENQEGEEIGVRKRETERKKMTVGSKGKS